MGELTRSTPKSALEVSRDWARMARQDRRRRAAQAIQTHDLTELEGLLRSFIVTRGQKKGRTSERTLATYASGLKTLMEWSRESGVMLHQLDDDAAGDYQAWLEEEYEGRITSINTKLAAARRMLAALEWTGLVDLREGDPLAGARIVDPTPPHERRGMYAASEVRQMLEVAGTVDLRAPAMILLGYDAGLRISEVASLDWRDVKPTDRRITVHGKGGQTQTVVVTERCIEALRDLGDHAAGPVFRDGRSTVNPKPITRQRVHVLFAKVCGAAGVERRGFHALRHSFVTRVLRASGGNLPLTQRQARHSDPSTTASYVHDLDEDTRKVMDDLAEMNGKA